jgi:hypothetical protein
MKRPLVNTYEINFWNIGDRMCSPVDYFSFSNPVDFHSIGTPNQQSEHWLEKDYDLLIGGGGLLYQGFRDTLQTMLSGARRSIFWGGGSNTHGGDDMEDDCRLLSEMDLVGVRDYGLPFRWVPCVSCMHGNFDKQVDRQSEVVVYEHQDYPIDLPGGADFPRMDNRESDFTKLIRFLGSAEQVITSSYHGAYWATLLGCKVVVTNSFSSKFKRFRHAPVISSSEEVYDSLKQARNYPDALLECRAANNDFAKDVAELLGSSPRKPFKSSVVVPGRRALKRARSAVKENLLQMRSDIVIDDDGTPESSLNIGKAFCHSRFIDAKFVLRSDRPQLFRGVFPGVIRKNSGSATGKLLCSLNKRMSPSDFVRELDEASTISGRFGRKIKRVAWDNEEASVQHQESICEGRVFVMTERKPSDEFVARLVRLFKGELIVFGPKFSRLSSADVIDLRGRIFLGQALTILRSSSVVIAEDGVYQEVAKRESSLHVGELKDGAEGHYDLWVRGADKSVAAEVQQALNLAAADAQ